MLVSKRLFFSLLLKQAMSVVMVVMLWMVFGAFLRLLLVGFCLSINLCITMDFFFIIIGGRTLGSTIRIRGIIRFYTLDNSIWRDIRPGFCSANLWMISCGITKLCPHLLRYWTYLSCIFPWGSCQSFVVIVTIYTLSWCSITYSHRIWSWTSSFSHLLDFTKLFSHLLWDRTNLFPVLTRFVICNGSKSFLVISVMNNSNYSSIIYDNWIWSGASSKFFSHCLRYWTNFHSIFARSFSRGQLLFIFLLFLIFLIIRIRIRVTTIIWGIRFILWFLGL